MSNDSDDRECPYCKEEIRADASRCRFCGSSVEPRTPAHGGTCPFCKEDVDPEATRCAHCGAYVGDLGPPQSALDELAASRTAPPPGTTMGPYGSLDADCFTACQDSCLAMGFPPWQCWEDCRRMCTRPPRVVHTPPFFEARHLPAGRSGGESWNRGW